MRTAVEHFSKTSSRPASPERRFCRLAAVLTLLAGLTLLSGCEKKEEAAKPGPPEVSVVEPLQQDVPDFEEYVAQLNGPVNAEITPKVQGYLLRQNYQNGFFVRQGELLFELDPRQYQAAEDQSKADVAVAEANLSRVQADVARDTPLAAQSAIPQKQLDNDVAEQQSWEAQLKAKKAALANAELNLGWTKVYSPIDGIAGVSNAQVGDLVGTATKMTTVSQVNPIWAYFNVSESRFLEFAPIVTRIITGKISPSQSGASGIEYIQANDQPFPSKGTIIYVNRQVGTSTGTIQLAAQFANPDCGTSSRRLRPRAYSERRDQRCAADPAARGHAGAVHVPGAGGHAAEQSRLPSGEGGRARGHELDHHRRPAAGRESSSRWDSEDPAIRRA